MTDLKLSKDMRYVLEYGVPGESGLTHDDANALPFQYANAFTILLTHGMLYWSRVHGRYLATAKGIVALEQLPTPAAPDHDSEEA